MHLGMAARAKRDHQRQNRSSRLPVMDDHLALAATRSITDPATIAIPFKYRFAQPTKVFRILPLQGVAARTKAVGQNLLPSAWTVHRALDLLHHFPAPLFTSVALALTARSMVWTETPK